MTPSTIAAKVRGRYQRTLSNVLGRRRFRMRNDEPLISFTFDDFPCSALSQGGEILKAYHAAGTFYTSLGLAGGDEPTGRIFAIEDLQPLLDDGHELGCHTYAHCDAWHTDPAVFEESVVANALRLEALHPDLSFTTHSYPVSCPRPATKRRMAKHFLCCRGGGQDCNTGTVDLNYLHAFFLEQCGEDINAVADLIEENRRLGGWLIFATHDVCDNPTRYGCTPSFFKAVVQAAVGSGTTILPMTQACEAIGIRT